jgi:hypothetical protein
VEQRIEKNRLIKRVNAYAKATYGNAGLIIWDNLGTIIWGRVAVFRERPNPNEVFAPVNGANKKQRAGSFCRKTNIRRAKCLAF